MISDPIELYITAAHPCPYLEGRQAMNLLVDPSRRMDDPTYSNLLSQGFRRSGGEVYRPCCRQCSACVSTRIPVSLFKANRSQRRNLKLNQDVHYELNRSGFRKQYIELYQRYIQSRHAGGGMDDDPPSVFAGFVVSPWCETVFMEFFHNDKLVGVSAVDVLQDGLSLVYTFFDPAFGQQRGLGIFAILQQIDWAKEAGVPYVYPGYWIAESPKMNYKTNFQPIEGYVEGRWLRLAKDASGHPVKSG